VSFFAHFGVARIADYNRSAKFGPGIWASFQVNWIVQTVKPRLKAIQTRFPFARVPEPV
jgi:hypothetical protein